MDKAQLRLQILEAKNKLEDAQRQLRNAKDNLHFWKIRLNAKRKELKNG